MTDDPSKSSEAQAAPFRAPLPAQKAPLKPKPIPQRLEGLRAPFLPHPGHMHLARKSTKPSED